MSLKSADLYNYIVCHCIPPHTPAELDEELQNLKKLLGQS